MAPYTPVPHYTHTANGTRIIYVDCNAVQPYDRDPVLVSKLEREVADLKRQLAASNRELHQLRNRRK